MIWLLTCKSDPEMQLAGILTFPYNPLSCCTQMSTDYLKIDTSPKLRHVIRTVPEQVQSLPLHFFIFLQSLVSRHSHFSLLQNPSLQKHLSGSSLQSQSSELLHSFPCQKLFCATQPPNMQTQAASCHWEGKLCYTNWNITEICLHPKCFLQSCVKSQLPLEAAGLFSV